MAHPNHLQKRIAEAIQNNGCDENFIEAAKMHLNVLQKYLVNKDNKTKHELCDAILSKLFLANLHIYPSKRFACQLDENFDWDFEIFPSEVFAVEKFPENFRKQRFIQCLKTADVLDCKVDLISATEYQLQVVHKYGCARLLFDLNMMVFLPRNQSEISLLRKELSQGELIRVAVFSIERSEQNIKILVTLDENTLQFSKKYITLGRIMESDLPLYLRRERSVYKSCKTLTDYLKKRSEFKNPSSLDSILSGFGIDEKRVYSFHPSIDGMSCPDELTGQGLLKAAKAKDLANFLNLAEAEQKSYNVSKTLEAIEVALMMDSKCSKAYEIRGTMYSKVDNRHLSRKALVDYEMAQNLDQENLPSRQYLCKSLMATAVKFYQKKDYQVAFEILQEVLKIDKDNDKASEFLIKFKAASKTSIRKIFSNEQEKINPEVLIEKSFFPVIKKEKTFDIESIFEKDTLVSLQKKKRELVSELNMFTIDD